MAKDYLECAAVLPREGGTGVQPCEKLGTSTCSKCKLVKYCCKEHQVAHWPQHKKLCKDPMLSPTWKPAWAAQNREPTWVTNESMPTMTGFGGRQYVWGNMTAIDCLNVARNEGAEKASRMDFNLCFAASGDIRNMVATVNGLPNDYTGTCNILLNDLDPYVFCRNILILMILLDPSTPLDEAVEMAVDLSYSVRLSKATGERVDTAAQKILAPIFNGHDVGLDLPYAESFPIRGRADLQVRATMGQLGYLAHRMDSKKPRDLVAALKSMHDVVAMPAREDYRDRYFSDLKPEHRLAASTYRKTGMVRPIGSHIHELTQPNRTLFSSEGYWLSPDAADPLQGWDAKAMFESGKRHGIPEGDIYGALFYHAKEQFTTFAQRVQSSQILVTITSFDACDLATIIRDEPHRLQSSWTRKGISFDRIETSNIADWMYVGPERVLSDWGPLLNRKNPHATLILHLMNWIQRQPDGTATGMGENDFRGQKSAGHAAMKAAYDYFASELKSAARTGRDQMSLTSSVLKEINLFYDNEAAFETFLGSTTKASAEATALGLVRRKNHTIVPKRTGLSLDKPSQKVPKLPKEEFYLLGRLQGSNWSDRYAEYTVKQSLPSQLESLGLD